MSFEDNRSSDSELGTDNSLIGKILVKMKSEFNKKPAIEASNEEPQLENKEMSENGPPKLIPVTDLPETNERDLLSSPKIPKLEIANRVRSSRRKLDSETSSNDMSSSEKLNSDSLSSTSLKKTVPEHVSEKKIVKIKRVEKKNVCSSDDSPVKETVDISKETQVLKESKRKRTRFINKTEVVSETNDVDKTGKKELTSLMSNLKINSELNQDINLREDTVQEKPSKLIKTSKLEQAGRRSLRNKSSSQSNLSPIGVKRSSRRISKDCSESVLQSAIARKEKSYNETAKPQRLSRRLKPTPKILANLEQCQKNLNLKNRITDKDIKSKSIKTSAEKSSSLEKSTPTKIIAELDECVSDIAINGDKSEIVELKTENIVEEKTVKEDTEVIDTIVNGESLLDCNVVPRKRKYSKNTSLKTHVSTVKKKFKTKQNLTLKIEQTDTESNTVNSSQTDHSDIDKSDVKPILTESKKYTKKRKDSDVESPVSEGALASVGVRRRSHRRAPSPNLAGEAERQIAAQPESSANSSLLLGLTASECLCRNKAKLYVSADSIDGIMYCTAIDSIDGRTIGCSNMISKSEVGLRRPSQRVPFIILCDVHLQRLIRHNCCPGCGMFCTQGRFVQCSSSHHYHRDCQPFINGTNGPKPCCPHCGADSPQLDVFITMRCSGKPAFLPSQRMYYPSAKFTFPSKSNGYKPRCMSPPLLPPEVFQLPSIEDIHTLKVDDTQYSLDDLYEAAEMGNYEQLIKIIACGVDLRHHFEKHNNSTALHAACISGNLVAVYLLVMAGAPIDAFDLEQRTPLIQSILEGHDDILKYLIKAGACITLKGTDGMTALHIAAKIGNLSACEILASCPTMDLQSLDCKDDGGWTPLVWACEHAHSSIVRFLLRKGADARIPDSERNSPLHWAAYGGDVDIIYMLLAAGCDINVVNVHGDSPLHVAARQDHYNCVLVLIARGAISNQKNVAGETPADCCGSDEPRGLCYTAITVNVQLQQMINLVYSQKKTLLTNDISKGKEPNPIQCVNFEDDEPLPTDYMYISENCFTSDINVDRKITTLQYCNCVDRCGTHDCKCSNISLRCWYDEEGKLSPEFNFLDPPMLFECNQGCGCNMLTCGNRVVQRGSAQRMQLFRVGLKGWGVKALRPIPRGSFVCEYIGELITDQQADKREDDSYLFDLDSREGETYCIDARRYGNIARFINHHCQPNLHPVRVFIDHHDLHFPRIAFFANRDIDADEELGFDYGEKFWIIKYKSFTCACGAENCRFSDSTIHTTLENYQRKMQEENALQEMF